jgi:ribonuclease-3
MSRSIQDIQELMLSWGFEFKTPTLLHEAFIHSSFLHEGRRCEEMPVASNERLEFLGDSVLGLIVSTEVMRKSPKASEGELSRLKSYFVSEKYLSARARDLGLGAYLVMSRGELQQGGQNRDSSLADIVEALLAATYLDCGLDAARRLCLERIFPELQIEGEAWTELERTVLQKDSKSRLQEFFQKKGLGTPRYVCVNEKTASSQGPFVMAVYVGDIELARLESGSKKEGTQLLAQRLLAMDPEKLVGFVSEKGFMTSG